jgi:cytoskeletal protein CcmA (bactofilin family)
VRGNIGPSLIGAGLVVVGRLDCAGDVQIDGRVDGEVHGQGVRIGSSAAVKGTVAGEIVHVAGTIEGNIEAESVILARTARVCGDISYRSLQIEEGAYFSGACLPRRKAAPAQRVEDNSVPSGCYVAPSNSFNATVSESVN